MSTAWTGDRRDHRAIYPFVCAICDQPRPAGYPLGKHRGEYVCAECAPGADDR